MLITWLAISMPSARNSWRAMAPAATRAAVSRALARSSTSRMSSWSYFRTPAKSAWPGRGRVTRRAFAPGAPLRHLGLDVHRALPVGPVAIADQQRDGCASRLAAPDAGQHLGAIGFNRHAPATSIAGLPRRRSWFMASKSMARPEGSPSRMTTRPGRGIRQRSENEASTADSTRAAAAGLGGAGGTSCGGCGATSAQKWHSSRSARPNRARLPLSAAGEALAQRPGMTHPGQPVSFGTLRCGRLIDTGAALIDLATGLSVRLSSRVLDPEAACRWSAVTPGTPTDTPGHVVLDAWLTRDWLGRWVERVVATQADDAAWVRSAPGWSWPALPPAAIGVTRTSGAGELVPECGGGAPVGARADPGLDADLRRLRRGRSVASSPGRRDGIACARGRSRYRSMGQARRSRRRPGHGQRSSCGVDRRRLRDAHRRAPTHAACHRPRGSRTCAPASACIPCARPRAALSLVCSHSPHCWRS